MKTKVFTANNINDLSKDLESFAKDHFIIRIVSSNNVILIDYFDKKSK